MAKPSDVLGGAEVVELGKTYVAVDPEENVVTGFVKFDTYPGNRELFLRSFLEGPSMWTPEASDLRCFSSYSSM
ncbi:hypothetical protein FOZ63_028376 [Perkinsus olseni]|uniref:Uncharacterized protein n=1 Tax=Perkinsus olseni TaxID=32597 RepID=A0A7J6THL6_PEROL|nr:hypothetical protein FOZ60_001604 [Perkinsus olseni]KAF4713489.1 hypothetical protein FOZ62_016603 [Perkinsus olseni]KAF4744401.1 hypothetical protein FOZ63_028376 [Perkinsus olseni]